LNLVDILQKKKQEKIPEKLAGPVSEWDWSFLRYIFSGVKVS